MCIQLNPPAWINPIDYTCTYEETQTHQHGPLRCVEAPGLVHQVDHRQPRQGVVRCHSIGVGSGMLGLMCGLDWMRRSSGGYELVSMTPPTG